MCRQTAYVSSPCERNAELTQFCLSLSIYFYGLPLFTGEEELGAAWPTGHEAGVWLSAAATAPSFLPYRSPVPSTCLQASLPVLSCPVLSCTVLSQCSVTYRPWSRSLAVCRSNSSHLPDIQKSSPLHLSSGKSSCPVSVLSDLQAMKQESGCLLQQQGPPPCPTGVQSCPALPCPDLLCLALSCPALFHSLSQSRPCPWSLFLSLFLSLSFTCPVLSSRTATPNPSRPAPSSKAFHQWCDSVGFKKRKSWQKRSRKTPEEDIFPALFGSGYGSGSNPDPGVFKL